MKRLLTKYGVIVLSLAVVIAVILSVMTYFSTTSAALPNVAGIIASPFRAAGAAITSQVEEWVDYFTEFDALKAENEELRQALAEAEASIRQAEYDREENARLRVLGELAPLPEDLRESIRRAEAESAGNTGITVNIALNYGGRDEIVHGVRSLARDCARGALDPEEITEELLASRLYTAGEPDPDFIIRPSGELRLSNFLLWQSAYSELLFMDVLWPDFTPEHLYYALHQYALRDRRFGGV